MLDLFKELAVTDPEYFCNSKFEVGNANGFFLGVGVFSLGDYYRILERRFQEKEIGTYVSNYYAHEVYEKTNKNETAKKYLFQTDELGNILIDKSGQPILLDSFKLRLRKEGWVN